MARAMQYYHCIAASGLNWTLEPGPSNSETVDSLKSFVDALPKVENG